jgi:hypothetical protein
MSGEHLPEEDFLTVLLETISLLGGSDVDVERTSGLST